MKSPYRKGVQITISNAAVQAAATMIAQAYRGGAAGGAQRIMNLASEIIDEYEARQGTPDEVIKEWAREVELAP